MTRRVGNIIIIEAEEPDICERCKKLEELRPYGKNGERVCYDCCTEEEKKIAYDKLFG